MQNTSKELAFRCSEVFHVTYVPLSSTGAVLLQRRAWAVKLMRTCLEVFQGFLGSKTKVFRSFWLENSIFYIP